MSKRESEGKLDTVIGADTKVNGDFRVTGSVRLDGQVEGKMEVDETFLAGQKSLLKGELRCRDAVIAGRIEGHITAAETVELQAGAEVFGDIRCKGIIIQRGCFFEGNCSMSQGREDAGRTPGGETSSQLP